MSNFVPFASQNDSSSDSRSGFTPLTPARLASSPDAPATELPSATPSDPCAQTPRVTLLRDQDRVTRIVVECPCGRKTELDCVY